MSYVQTIESAFKKHSQSDEAEKPFIIGVRFGSGVTEIIQVEEATDGYILGRIKTTKGTFSKTIRTIQTATIEYFERVEK